jgi:hypothetical protein
VPAQSRGIVAQWKHGRYHTDGVPTSWLKVKNPDYSQVAGRRDLFERRRHHTTHARPRRWSVPVLSLTHASAIRQP